MKLNKSQAKIMKELKESFHGIIGVDGRRMVAAAKKLEEIGLVEISNIDSGWEKHGLEVNSSFCIYATVKLIKE